MQYSTLVNLLYCQQKARGPLKQRAFGGIASHVPISITAKLLTSYRDSMLILNTRICTLAQKTRSQAQAMIRELSRVRDPTPYKTGLDTSWALARTLNLKP